MKNAMKKIMSLVLVAMILVSALPFAASAASANVPVVVYIDGVETVTRPLTVTDDYALNGNTVMSSVLEKTEGRVFSQLLNNDGEDVNGKTLPADWAAEQVNNGYYLKLYVITGNTIVPPQETEPEETESETQAQPVKAKLVVNYNQETLIQELQVGDTVTEAGVKALIEQKSGKKVASIVSFTTLPLTMDGDENINVAVEFAAEPTTAPTTPPATTAPTTGADNSYNANNGTTSNQNTSYSKFHYEVYLNVYTDTTVGTVKKTIKITDGIAADGKVTLNEVKNLVYNYYKANSSAGIQFDGLYPAKGNWVLNYVVDTKYDTIEGLYEAAAKDYVYINVMLTNASAISSGTADSSNPKTGDELYKAVTVMAISASALAVAFYFNKKRAIV